MKFSHLPLLFLLCILQSCGSCSLGDKAQNALDSALAEVKEEMRQDSINRARREQLAYQIDSLKLVDFRTSTSRTHSDLWLHSSLDRSLDPDRNGLMALVYEESESIVLISTLPEIHGMLHNRIEIEIAGTTYAADSNYTYPLTVPDGNGFTSVPDAKGEVLYILEEDAMDLIEAIVANPAEEIKVTAYFNDEVYASYTLSESDKQAIIATYNFLLMIKERNVLETEDVEWDD